MAPRTLTAVIYREEDTFVAEGPAAGAASQGGTVEDGVEDPKYATELCLEEILLAETEKPIFQGRPRCLRCARTRGAMSQGPCRPFAEGRRRATDGRAGDVNRTAASRIAITRPRPSPSGKGRQGGRP